MAEYHDESFSETAKFIGLCDRLFDCLNSRSEKEGAATLKPDLLPYTSVDDTRFKVVTITVQI
jgi:hypothetical protein